MRDQFKKSLHCNKRRKKRTGIAVDDLDTNRNDVIPWYYESS